MIIWCEMCHEVARVTTRARFCKNCRPIYLAAYNRAKVQAWKEANRDRKRARDRAYKRRKTERKRQAAATSQ